MMTTAITTTNVLLLLWLLLLLLQRPTTVLSFSRTIVLPTAVPARSRTTFLPPFQRYVVAVVPQHQRRSSSDSNSSRRRRRRRTTTMMMTSNDHHELLDQMPPDDNLGEISSSSASAINDDDDDDNDEKDPTTLLSSPAVPTTTSTATTNTATTTSRFLQGDELHRLRRRVVHMKQSLYIARQQQDIQQIQQLTCAILAAQNLDAEYIYSKSLQQQQQALYTGRHDEAALFATQAKEARETLLQFSLSGLWVGKYHDNNHDDDDDSSSSHDNTSSSSSSSSSFQLINVTYSGDVLTAYKITASSSCHVPVGEMTFSVDLTPPTIPSFPSSSHLSQQYQSHADQIMKNSLPRMTTDTSSSPTTSPQPYLEPIPLHNTDAMEQWGIQYLQRHAGMGQVSQRQYQNPQWINGQLILINEQYFSFVWMPTQHHVFFGRPSPELILKLLREHESNNDMRQYLERCYEETLLMDDDMEVNDTSLFTSHDQTQYYIQDGCFE